MHRSRPTEHPGVLRALLLAAFLTLLGACGGSDATADVPSDGGMPANTAVAPETPAAGAPEIPADAPRVAILGDSLAAGLHLARDEAFPAVLQRLLAEDGLPFHLVNAGVSGDTTAGGVARVDWLLRQEPAVVVIELGANDGFRGVPLATIEENLRAIVMRVRAGGAEPLLLGIRLPPNYGDEYAGGFDALYERVAQETGTAHVPFFMEGVAGVPEMNLPDGIHPTPEGHRKLAANVRDALADLLQP